MNNYTIKTPLILSGKGLHTGIKYNIIIQPSIGDGIEFILGNKAVFNLNNSIDYLKETELSTTLEYKNVQLTTIEHLLAALNALNITNISIELYTTNPTDFYEIPILDGSSKEFFIALKESKRTYIETNNIYVTKLHKIISNTDPNKYCYASLTSDNIHYSYYIDYDNKFIGKRNYLFELNETSFEKLIMDSKTFVLKEQIDNIKKDNKIKGGDNTNALIVDKNYVENYDLLTFYNEPVRHKILDMIGDSYIFGRKIVGNFHGNKTGHIFNSRLMKSIFENK